MPTTLDEPMRLLVHRQNLRNTCVAADPDAQRPLADGQARLRIDSFALTANNVTYAAFGEAMQYWALFPTGSPSLGCIPVWGHATVEESTAPGITPGQRCFGFWPMGSHLVVQPERVDHRGFSDGSVHRSALPAPYNRVQFCAHDAALQRLHEARQALLRPLFTTAFLIDDYLAEHGYFGARQVLLSSASSKTAYGTALCLAGREGGPQQSLSVVGLTAAANLGFTRSLGCYSRALAYEDLQALDPTMPSVYVDLSGSSVQRQAVHRHFGSRLSHSCAVGGAHWDALGPDVGLPGPRPTVFFSPGQLRKRAGPPPEGWGPEGFQQRIQAAWGRLMAAMDASGGSPWLQVHERRGVEAVREVYLSLVEGRADPRAGHLLSMWPPQA